MIPSGAAVLAGVIGWPVAHSLSPRVHGFWLARHGIDGAYVPLPVRPEDLGDVLRTLPKLGFKGANVTVPHKEQALRVVDTASDEARRIGAVNTVVFDNDGRSFGTNTDAFGFIESLAAAVPTWRAATGAAVILGAGGAARAVAAALQDADFSELRIVNRTLERAEALAAALGGLVRAYRWNDWQPALSGVGLLVNTTTLGMAGQPPLAVDLAPLPPAAAVVDIVYRPLMTPLLRAAAARGHPVVDGLGMLLHQARPGFAAWFGMEPAVDDALRAFVLEGIPGEW